MDYLLQEINPPRRCLFCGELIPDGRLGKKFCSESCKNRYHNNRRYPRREEVKKKVIRSLERNHLILEKLVRLGISSLDRVTLVSLGYDVNYVTSYRKVGVHHQYTCFDYHYELTPTRIKKIVCTSMEEGADERGSGRGSAF